MEMKKLLLLACFSTVFLSQPSHAITWKEFWEPFTEERSHRHHHHRHVHCTKRVRREEYVPGNRWRSGYVRTWYENVPCRRHYY